MHNHSIKTIASCSIAHCCTLACVASRIISNRSLPSMKARKRPASSDAAHRPAMPRPPPTEYELFGTDSDAEPDDKDKVKKEDEDKDKVNKVKEDSDEKDKKEDRVPTPVQRIKVKVLAHEKRSSADPVVVNFTMRPDTLFERLMNAWCDYQCLPRGSAVFSHKGVALKARQSPAHLGFAAPDERVMVIQAEPAAVSWGTLLARWNSGELKGHIEE